MKKTGFLVGLAILSMVLAAGMGFAEEAKGPRIELEEEEIILMEDGKEIKRLYVGRSGKEKEAVLKEVKEKAFRKLGVESEEDLNKKDLWPAYNKEMQNLMKTQPLPEPKVKFIDEAGKVIKEISLKTEEKITEGITEETPKRKDFIDKRVRISKEGRHIGLLEFKGFRTMVAETAYENEIAADTSVFKYIDIRGEVLWERNDVNTFTISDDGTKVAVVQWFGGCENILRDPNYREKIIVLDEKGNELFDYEFYEFKREPSFTKNAFYGEIESYLSREDLRQGTSVVIYFNISTKNVYVSFPKDGHFSWMDNEGTIRIYKKKFEEVVRNGRTYKKAVGKELIEEIWLLK